MDYGMKLTITLWSVLWTDNFCRTKVEGLPQIEETGVSPFFVFLGEIIKDSDENEKAQIQDKFCG